VRDTGIGIPASKVAQIFEPFSQADASTTRKYGGTGLGLTISARLVEMMGGKIWVESEEAKGSWFHFTLEMGVVGEGGSVPVVEAVALQGTRVLVVDDNATNRRILAAALGRWGMEVTTEASGAEALQILEAAADRGEPLELMITDAHMPGMDGITLAERVIAGAKLGGCKVMMLASSGQRSDIVRCRQAGLMAYLTKPVRRAELWQSIQQVLGQPVHAAERAEIPPRAEEETARRGEIPNGKLKILLAEDNVVNQELARRLLEKSGHAVTVVGNGREALERLREQTYHLVLMDVQMPEMDGFEATAAIREQEAKCGGHLPIIAMTAHVMKGDRERCIERGMDEYVAKPIHKQKLYEAIEAVLAGTATGARTLRLAKTPEEE
jgi:two-component system, sensor histidine kinase and response regulator